MLRSGQEASVAWFDDKVHMGIRSAPDLCTKIGKLKFAAYTNVSVVSPNLERDTWLQFS